MASPVKILLVLFPGFNTLDMNGPYEVLRKSKGGDLFTITVAAESEITTSCEGVHVKVRIHLLTICQNLAHMANCGDCCVLLFCGRESLACRVPYCQAGYIREWLQLLI